MSYDQERRPDGILYQRACVYLTEIAKTQAKRIESLETENTEIKTRLDRLEDLVKAGAPKVSLSGVSLPIIALALLGSLFLRNRRGEGGGR